MGQSSTLTGTVFELNCSWFFLIAWLQSNQDSLIARCTPHKTSKDHYARVLSWEGSYPGNGWFLSNRNSSSHDMQGPYTVFILHYTYKLQECNYEFTTVVYPKIACSDFTCSNKSHWINLCLRYITTVYYLIHTSFTIKWKGFSCHAWHTGTVVTVQNMQNFQ